MPSASAICRTIKENDPGTRIILVGGHVAALPARTLREESADFVCGGEGFWTLTDLLEALTCGGRPNFAEVRDLYYWEDSTMKVGPAASLVQDLDANLPAPPWHMLPMTKGRAHNWHCFGDLPRQPYAAMYTSLGCPFHCTFCCIQAPFRRGELAAGYSKSVNSYRTWSAKSVIDQIDLLVDKYGISNLKIADEIFVLKPSRVTEICDLIIERKYKLNIWAYARVDTLRDGMLEKLKLAGFNWLALGIESANERVREEVNKNFHSDRLCKVIENLKTHEINIIGNYMFGLPEDTFETMQETLSMAIDLNCEFSNFYCNMAYPGSALYEVAVKEGWPLPSDWGAYSQHSVDTTPLPTRYLSAADVLRFRDQAFERYFSNERYLSMIGKRFGVQTLNHIHDMLSRKLVRKILEEQERTA